MASSIVEEVHQLALEKKQVLIKIADVVQGLTHKITADFCIDNYGKYIKVINQKGPVFMYDDNTAL
jgi:hypothetical protein